MDNRFRGARRAETKCGARRSGGGHFPSVATSCLPGLGDIPGAKSPARGRAGGPASAQQTVRGRGEGGEENHPVSSPAPTADHVPGLSREL